MTPAIQPLICGMINRFSLICFLILLTEVFCLPLNASKKNILIPIDSSWEVEMTTADKKKETVRLPRIFFHGNENFTYRGPLKVKTQISPELSARILKGENLAFNSGWVTGHVIELSVNGHRVASIGSMAPFNPAMGRHLIAVIPGSLLKIDSDNHITVTFHITDSDRTAHGFREIPRIAPTDVVYASYYREIIISFCLVTIYVVVGIVFLMLGMRRIKKTYNLYFGLFSLFFAIFEVANLPCREAVFLNSVLLEMRMDHVSLKFMISGFILFATHLLTGRYGRPVMISVSIAIILGFVDLFKDYSYSLDDRFNFWIIPIAIALPYILFHLAVEIKKKSIDTLVMAPGILIFLSGAAHDILVDYNIISGKMILPYTTLAVFLNILMMLIIKFIRTSEKLEELNIDLEDKVKKRTAELQDMHARVAHLKRKEKFLNSFNITSREREILSLMMEGYAPGEISQNLTISIRTVNNHIYNMYQKLGIHSQMEILALFNRFE